MEEAQPKRFVCCCIYGAILKQRGVKRGVLFLTLSKILKVCILSLYSLCSYPQAGIVLLYMQRCHAGMLSRMLATVLIENRLCHCEKVNGFPKTGWSQGRHEWTYVCSKLQQVKPENHLVVLSISKCKVFEAMIIACIL